MVLIYSFCDKNATAAVEEYLHRFSYQQIPSKKVFTKVVNNLCGTGTLFRYKRTSEQANSQTLEEREDIWTYWKMIKVAAHEVLVPSCAFPDTGMTKQLIVYAGIDPIYSVYMTFNQKIMRNIFIIYGYYCHRVE